MRGLHCNAQRSGAAAGIGMVEFIQSEGEVVVCPAGRSEENSPNTCNFSLPYNRPHLKGFNPKRPSYHRGWWHIVLVLEPSVTFTENWLADRDIGSALGLLQPWQAEILWRSLPWHLRLRAFFGHALFRLQALQAAARKFQERGSRR